MGDIENEIVPGLVLHFDPDVVEAEGGTFTGPPAKRVRGPHFFMCIAIDDTMRSGTWVPLFSGDGAGRVALDKSTAYGHPKWNKGGSYFHPDQVWTVPHAAVAVAAKAGGDLSRPGSRNGVAAEALPSTGGPEDGSTAA